MDRREALLLAVLLLAVVIVVMSPLRPLLVIPLMLLVPGFLVGRSVLRQPAGLAERLVMSLALSFVLIVLAGLVLHVTVGLTVTAWAIALGALVTLAVLTGRGDAPDLPLQKIAPPRLLQGGALLLAVALVGASAATASRSAEASESRESVGVAEIWMLPTNDGEAVEIGVGNLSTQPETMRVVVKFGGVSHTWRVGTVPAGRTMTQTLAIGEVPADAARLQATLYVEPGDAAYGRVWMPVALLAQPPGADS